MRAADTSRGRATKFDLLIAVLLIGLAFAASSCSSDGVSEGRCERALDHLIDLRLKDVAASPTTAPTMPPVRVPQGRGKDAHFVDAPAPVLSTAPINMEPHRAAMKQALGKDFVASCQRQLTSAQLKCVLSANDSTSASACTTAQTASK